MSLSRTTTEIPIAEAKAKLAEYIRRAEGGEVLLLTRHGKAAVALISANDAEKVERLRAAGPEKGLAGLAGGWPGSDELAGLALEHRRSKPRTTARLR